MKKELSEFVEKLRNASLEDVEDLVYSGALNHLVPDAESLPRVSLRKRPTDRSTALVTPEAYARGEHRRKIEK